MTNEITDTYDANPETDDYGEPKEPDTHMVATVEPENKGIEFHVSMRGYTLQEMDNLIVEAAARQIVGRRADSAYAKDVEAKCIELVNAKAGKVLEGITTDIIDQPLTPNFGDKKPVTMREFLGLYGREYLSERVDSEGRPSTGGWGSSTNYTRMEWFVIRAMQKNFKDEIEKATRAAILEVQAELKKAHVAMLEEHKAKLRDALSVATKAA